MTCLMLSLLLLLCHENCENWHSSPAGHVVGATVGHQQGKSVAPSSRKRSSRSCQPLGGFVSCYDVVHIPTFTEDVTLTLLTLLLSTVVNWTYVV